MELVMRRRGFTLLELLLALAALALLALLTGAALRLGLRLAEAGRQQHEAFVDRAVTLGVLERELTRLRPLPAPPSENNRGIGLRGTSRDLLYPAVLPAAVGGGLAWLRLAQHEGADAPLVIERFAYDAQPRALPPVETIRLMDDVAALRLAYLARARPGQPARWLDAWQDELELPAAIRIDIAAGPAGALRSYTVLARPRVDALPAAPP
jgi:prepilin-type N-terminal cleavage/methylation domain-containing protein